MDDVLVKWAENRTPGLVSFLKKLIERRDILQSSALMPGDTEYKKGQVEALNWVIGLPDRIIEESKTDPDT